MVSSFSANVSLLNNFEIVATSLIALLIFKEAISRRLWLAIGLIPVILLLGFVSYGLSIFFYVYAQRRPGAALTIMAAGTYFAAVNTEQE